MTSLNFAEKTRIGGIFRRLMLDENRETLKYRLP